MPSHALLFRGAVFACGSAWRGPTCMFTKADGGDGQDGGDGGETADLMDGGWLPMPLCNNSQTQGTAQVM